MSTERKKTMVVGGGIAGLTAAWELARQGVDVELVEKSPFLGGYAIQFSCKAKAGECQQCGACSVEKMLKNVVEEPNITVHLGTSVEKITGSGPFTASLAQAPAYIDPEKCTNCGVCYEKCPEKDAILRGYSKNNAPLYAIDGEKLPLIEAFAKDACPEGAISIDAQGQAFEISADAVVMATGFKPFDATIKGTYGYGKFSNVITGMDLERIKRENGTVVRPTDGKCPDKIAFIQCVGSRDERLGNLWCSKVCCPYALRTAQTIKDKAPESDISVFYMDIQNTGNNFPAFYESCKSEFRFVRNIPVDIYPLENDRVSMRYMNEEAGEAVIEEFDLVVLSHGIMPGADNPSLAELFGIELNDDGFIRGTDELNKTLTSKAGIFVAGTAEGPKTIATSMAHAGQSAREAVKYVGGA